MFIARVLIIKEKYLLDPKFMKRMKNLFKNKDFLLILIYLLSLPIFGLLNRPIGIVRNLYSPVDDVIPYVPQFILIYHSWFPFLMANAYALYKTQRIEYRKYMMHLIVGQFAAYLTFIVFQTDVTRAIHLGDSVFDKLVALTYHVDNHYAGFPSVHALTTMVLIMTVLRSKFKTGYKVFAIFYSVLILGSILLVKQHVFWDLPSGIVYGVITFPLAMVILKRVFPEYLTYDNGQVLTKN